MILSRVVTVVQALALALAVCALVLLVVKQPPPPVVPPPALDVAAGPGGTAPAPDGQAIYLDQCAACHGDFGEGTYAPALRNGAARTRFPDVAAQIAVVQQGSAGTSMKGFADKLSPEQIQAVVDYTRTL
jgi:mono/diheme cytochrome c family protein